MRKDTIIDLKTFIIKIDNKINEEALTEFFYYCRKNKLVYTNIINLIIIWLEKFNVDIYNLSFLQLEEYYIKRKERISRLRSEGKHQSIIDLSLFEIYAPSKEIALEFWNNLNLLKKEKTEAWSSVLENRIVYDTNSLNYFISKFGEIEGNKLYLENIKTFKKNSKRCKEYWIDKGFSESEAKEKVAESQKMFSLDICIENLGEEAGYKKWKDRQDRWQETLNSKSEEEKKEINKKKGYKRLNLSQEDKIIEIEKNSKRFFSNESILFFKKYINTEKWFFGEKEWYIFDRENHRYYFYDFTNLKNKIILEYHGHAFHPNLKILSEESLSKWKHPFTKISANEQLEIDKYKNN